MHLKFHLHSPYARLLGWIRATPHSHPSIRQHDINLHSCVLPLFYIFWAHLFIPTPTCFRYYPICGHANVVPFFSHLLSTLFIPPTALFPYCITNGRASVVPLFTSSSQLFIPYHCHPHVLGYAHTRLYERFPLCTTMFSLFWGMRTMPTAFTTTYKLDVGLKSRHLLSFSIIFTGTMNQPCARLWDLPTTMIFSIHKYKIYEYEGRVNVHFTTTARTPTYDIFLRLFGR
jgi:hypothetical protein